MTLSADRLRVIRRALDSDSEPLIVLDARDVRDMLDAIPDPRDLLVAEALVATRRPDVADRLQAARTAQDAPGATESDAQAPTHTRVPDDTQRPPVGKQPTIPTEQTQEEA